MNRAAKLETASVVLANLAYVALCAAALVVLFPGLRLYLQQAAVLSVYRLRLIALQLGSAPAPAWLGTLARDDLPQEGPAGGPE